MKKLRPIYQDPDTYIQNVGKDDQHHVADALQDEGADTTLRICLWRHY